MPRLLRILLLTIVLAPPLPRFLLAQEEVVVFLVRHAERADDGVAGTQTTVDPQTRNDPPISEVGRARATQLAEILRDAGITHIHSTDYLRTKQTAAPLAARTGLGVSTYDNSDPDGFASELRSTPGRHLVVGHSNSTPELVKALGGNPGEPIESLEYDRLYIVTIGDDSVSTVLLRFGEP